jgi:hypothetical protein
MMSAFSRWPLPGFLRRHHHAEVDHLEVVAAEHHADDVLADVVHVTLDGGHDDLAVVLAHVAGAQLFFLDEGQQVGDGFFHHAGGLHHLRQKHLAGAEQVADHVHAVHQRAFDHVERARRQLARFLGVLDDVLIDAVHQRVAEALAHGHLTPGHRLDDNFAFLLAEVVGDLQQALGGILAAIEHHVLDALAQLGIEVVVDRQRTGVDDAHVHAGLDGVVQEHRMDGLAHGVVAAERERDVGDAAGNMAIGETFFHLARGLDEIHRVVVVLLDTGGDGEDVGIEDDVFRREVELTRQQFVGALNRSRPCARRCRPGLVRRRPSPRRRRRSAAPCARGRGTAPRLPSSRWS